MITEDEIRSSADELVAIRRDLHANPELAFQEYRTSELVANALTRYGWKVSRGLGGTGVVGTLTRGCGRRSIGLRADMDALPISETTGLPYASRNAGKMHACGHDGHVAMLLAAAKALAEKGDFDGTVHVIFQPAEEDIGGAERMIREGLFKEFPCDAVFGLHNFPGFPAGRFLFRKGVFTAAADFARVTIRGVGGHAAVPHLTVDPIVIASTIIVSLQTVVARNINPSESAIVSVGTFHAGSASNIIPDDATFDLSIRSFDEEIRDQLEVRLNKLIEDQAASFGAKADICYQRCYPATVSSDAETDFARSVACDVAGSEEVVDLKEPFAGSEDFSFMLRERPGCFFGLGIGDEPDRPYLHEARYDFNDECILPGAAMWARMAESYLAA